MNYLFILICVCKHLHTVSMLFFSSHDSKLEFTKLKLVFKRAAELWLEFYIKLTQAPAVLAIPPHFYLHILSSPPHFIPHWQVSIREEAPLTHLLPASCCAASLFDSFFFSLYGCWHSCVFLLCCYTACSVSWGFPQAMKTTEVLIILANQTMAFGSTC